MKRIILSIFGVAVLVVAATFGSVFAVANYEGHSDALPNLAEQAPDAARIRVHGVGHTLSQPDKPSGVAALSNGLVRVTFDYRAYFATQFDVYYNGELVTVIPAPPACKEQNVEGCINGVFHIYTLNFVFGATGDWEASLETERQVSWYGSRLGYRYIVVRPYALPECGDGAGQIIKDDGTERICIAQFYEVE